MPFHRPLLRDLIQRIAEDIAARLPGAVASMRRSMLGVLARVVAGGLDGVYGYLSWLGRQLFPDTAESAYLNRWAAIWGVTRKLASVAEGRIRVTGLSGSVVSVGTLWSKSGNNQPPILLSSTQDVTIPAGGVALIPARAVDAGSAGNLAAGVRVSLVTSIAGVMADARIDAPWGGWADVESDESLRERLLSRIQQPPEGGSVHDYLRWALEVPGVARAWIYPHRLGLGTVGVMVMWQDGAKGDRVPTDGELKIVFEHIDVLRPVTAGLFVFAPIARAIDLTVRLQPMTEAVKAAAIANLTDLFMREGAPGGVLLISHIREAISTATGEWDHVVEVAAGPGLSFDRYGNVSITHGFGIPKLGKVTWLTL